MIAISMAEPADVNTRLRRLPKVDEVLRDEAALRLLERAPRWAVVDAIRLEIEALRARLLAGGVAGGVAVDVDGLEPQLKVSDEALRSRVEGLVRPSLVRVLNATGVVLHTNIGRAPLAARPIARIA